MNIFVEQCKFVLKDRRVSQVTTLCAVSEKESVYGSASAS